MVDYNHKNDWFFEGQVSSKLVSYFRENGYTILKDNSNNIRAKGEDIVVSLGGRKEIVEVKGYPTTKYTNGKDRIGTPKRTNPKQQAKHWFSEAILTSLSNYGSHVGDGEFEVALAFPLFDRYKKLIASVEDFFSDCDINLKVYFVDESGQVTIDNLNRKYRFSD